MSAPPACLTHGVLEALHGWLSMLPAKLLQVVCLMHYVTFVHDKGYNCRPACLLLIVGPPDARTPLPCCSMCTGGFKEGQPQRLGLALTNPSPLRVLQYVLEVFKDGYPNGSVQSP